MISWDRHGDRLILTFSPRQVRWLRSHLTQCQQDIDQAEQVGTTETSQLTPERRSASIASMLAALPHRGGVVIVDESDRLPWAWTVQDLKQEVSVRLSASQRDDARVVRARTGLLSWLDEVIARLTANVTFSDIDEKQLLELTRDADGRQD